MLSGNVKAASLAILGLVSALCAWVPGPMLGICKRDQRRAAMHAFVHLLTCATLSATYARVGGAWWGTEESLAHTTFWQQAIALGWSDDWQYVGSMQSAWCAAIRLIEKADWWLFKASEEDCCSIVEVDVSDNKSLANVYLQPWVRFACIGGVGVHKCAELAVAIARLIPQVEDICKMSVADALATVVTQHGLNVLPVPSLLALHSGSRAASARVAELGSAPNVRGSVPILRLKSPAGVMAGSTSVEVALAGTPLGQLRATLLTTPALAGLRVEAEPVSDAHDGSSLADSEEEPRWLTASTGAYTEQLYEVFKGDVDRVYAECGWRGLKRGAVQTLLCCVLVMQQYHEEGDPVWWTSGQAVAERLAGEIVDMLRVVEPGKRHNAQHVRDTLALHLGRIEHLFKCIVL